jgi:hypothetical protein
MYRQFNIINNLEKEVAQELTDEFQEDDLVIDYITDLLNKKQ